MKKNLIPSQAQPALPVQQMIVNENPQGPDVVPLDVVFVGAGPAGLAGAIELARLAKKNNMALEIGVLEKAGNLGGHSLSGAVLNPMAFKELFPEMKIEDFPFRRPVTKEKVMMLTETGSIPLPTPPTMQNHGNYIASLCEVVKWMGQQAEGLGVNILSSFPADALYVENNKVIGVRTTAAGLGRDGQPGANAMPPTQITAKVTVLSEGTRGPLAQAYREWQKISSPAPQIFALGVKEIWRVKKAPEAIVHTLGYPLPKDAFGGSWLYPMADDLISIGLVAGLDYKSSHFDVHYQLQKMKQHPFFAEILKDGECVEWGAKTIPEGGFHALPEKFTGDGVMMIGDTVGFVNVPALKGIHYAMMSGIYAARTLFEALKDNDVSGKKLSSFDQTMRESFICKEMHKVRNMRLAFKSGFFVGGAKASLMTLTQGMFPGDQLPYPEDAAEHKEIPETAAEQPKVGLSKVDAVYLSGNKTRDDIPQHLIVGKDISPEMADFYSHVCPAGVYERKGDQLTVNAPNCVDCKATDVVGPRWTPREGGSGPDYKMM